MWTVSTQGLPGGMDNRIYPTWGDATGVVIEFDLDFCFTTDAIATNRRQFLQGNVVLYSAVARSISNAIGSGCSIIVASLLLQESYVDSYGLMQGSAPPISAKILLPTVCVVETLA